MDRDRTWELELPEPDLSLDDGDGGSDSGEPPEPGGEGPRRVPTPAPVPATQSWWAVLIPVVLLLIFGGQSLLILQVSRAGLGTEAVAWALIALFTGTFTIVFFIGAKYIDHHRRA